MAEEQVDLEILKWSIKQRYEVQMLGHRLLRLMKENSAAPRTKKIQMRSLLAATFALWRAAFLAGHKSKTEESFQTSQKFLEKVLVDNTVTFGFDVVHRKWTFRFYIDAARFYLETLERQWPELHVKSSSDTRTLFNNTLAALKKAYGLVKKNVNTTPKRRLVGKAV